MRTEITCKVNLHSRFMAVLLTVLDLSFHLKFYAKFRRFILVLSEKI